MRMVAIPSAWPAIIPRSKLWLLIIATLSVLPLNFDRQFDGLTILAAQAAVPQCAAKPQVSSRCPQSSCMKAGPCYFGILYQQRACLKWRCAKARRS
jgi:hypothetical protein